MGMTPRDYLPEVAANEDVISLECDSYDEVHMFLDWWEYQGKDLYTAYIALHAFV